MRELLLIGGAVALGLFFLHKSGTTTAAAAAANTSANLTGTTAGMTDVYTNLTDQLFGTVNNLLTGSTSGN